METKSPIFIRQRPTNGYICPIFESPYLINGKDSEGGDCIVGFVIRWKIILEVKR
jgi:hypothetical protein